MAVRPVALIVCSDAQRRDAWESAVRRAGHWALAASTVHQALALLHKLRPTLMLSEATLTDADAVHLIREMRAVPPLQRVPVVILDRVTPEVEAALVRDPCVRVDPALGQALLSAAPLQDTTLPLVALGDPLQRLGERLQEVREDEGLG